MARVVPVAHEDCPPNLDGSLLSRIYAHRPAFANAFFALERVSHEERSLSPRLVELVRLRIAYLNQCRGCMVARHPEGVQDGVTEDLVCELMDPEVARGLTDAERAAITYGELVATNHLAVTDETFERLREHFDEAQIVELCLNVALFVGFGRVNSTLHMVDELPEAFQAPTGQTLAPWNQDELLFLPSRTPQRVVR